MNASTTLSLLVSQTNWRAEYFSGIIAGIYAVDALLSETETLEIASRMYRGEDTSMSNCTCGADYWDMEHQDCKICPTNSSIQKQNSKDIRDCQCNAGYEGPDGGECLPCPAGTFKLGLGSTCSDCPDGTYGIASDSPCIDCPYGTYNLVPGADSSDLCLSCGPGKYYQDLR